MENLLLKVYITIFIKLLIVVIIIVVPECQCCNNNYTTVLLVGILLAYWHILAYRHTSINSGIPAYQAPGIASVYLRNWNNSTSFSF